MCLQKEGNDLFYDHFIRNWKCSAKNKNSGNKLILVELEKKSDNIYNNDFLIDIGVDSDHDPKIVDSLNNKSGYKLSFEIDFSGDKPIYKVKIVNPSYEGGIYKGDNVVHLDLLSNCNSGITKRIVKCLFKVNTDEEIEKCSKFLVSLLRNEAVEINESNKKWALLKVITVDNKEVYMFSNDIESVDLENENACSFFHDTITSLEVLKSDCTDVENLINCFNSCYIMKNVNLEKLKTDKDLKLSFMFYGCTNLQNVQFPKGMKVKRSIGLFWHCMNLKSVNLENLVIENADKLSNMFINSKIDYLKFPKVSIDVTKNSVNRKKGPPSYEGIIRASVIGKLDISNVTFTGDACGFFKNLNTASDCEIGELILNEGLKDLSEKQINRILRYDQGYLRIGKLSIGSKSIAMEENDDPKKWIKNPDEYISNRAKIQEDYQQFMRCDSVSADDIVEEEDKTKLYEHSGKNPLEDKNINKDIPTNVPGGPKCCCCGNNSCCNSCKK